MFVVVVATERLLRLFAQFELAIWMECSKTLARLTLSFAVKIFSDQKRLQIRKSRHAHEHQGAK